MTLAFPKPTKKPKRDPYAVLGKEYMGYAATLACRCCGRIPCEVHHCFCGRFSQRKASDFHTIPLCYEHHRGQTGIHSQKTTWMANYGPDHDFIPEIQQEIERVFGFRVPDEFILIKEAT